MVRVRPTAEVSDWLYSVAEVLPLQHRAVRPYSLGEAVAELGAYARAVDPLDWKKFHCKGNRSSLRREIEAQSRNLGKTLGASILPMLATFSDDADQAALVYAAEQFEKAWQSKASVADAFEDLCEAAKEPAATSRALRKLSAVIASQVGPAAFGSFSQLTRAANVLVDTEEDLARGAKGSIPRPLTERQRCEMARNELVDMPFGRVVVWTAYFRAEISQMREVIGSVTFLDAHWVLQSVFDEGSADFPELAELREISETGLWLEKIYEESLKPENRLVLVRVELGERQAAGAAEAALRQIEAILAVAVEAGGASWQCSGTTVVRLDGEAHHSSYGYRAENGRTVDDRYGMRGTADLLSNFSRQLGVVLAKRSMPEHLVEALISLREARMTDHRDVVFNDVRRVTPRVATALEDHAQELIASVLGVRPDALAAALKQRETLAKAGSQIANQLVAPFNNAWSVNFLQSRKDLEQAVHVYNRDHRRVSVRNAVALQTEILDLPMTVLQRADFENAIAICTSPEHELRFLDEMSQEADVLRDRHRRVRNAVNHGLPLDGVTLGSVRDYAFQTSSSALNIALSWLKSGEKGANLLQREEDAWSERICEAAQGVSWVERDAQAEGGS